MFLLIGVAAAPAAATTQLPAGFGDRVAFAGLTEPTAVEFAPDGRVFVAEKSGLIKMFDGPTDTSAIVIADLRTEVHNFWDRGLLDIALDPDFTHQPYVYALYTRDAKIGGTAPLWGSAGATSDGCPSPPGATGDGCVVSGRLSRFRLTGETLGEEQVLVDGWCQQYPSHSVGSIAFDSGGALLASGGDGASFIFTDYGQDGDPLNPCGDPPSGVGGVQRPPSAEGGSLRSQDLRTPGDPTGLNGSVIRVDRSNGSPIFGNPRYGQGGFDANAQRIVASGLRNPFRITIRPDDGQLYIGDVGNARWEEIDAQSPIGDKNFGWPCEEGPDRQNGFDAADVEICEDLYADPSATTEPLFAYDHSGAIVPGESCEYGSSSISGLAFYEGGPFPARYDGALFFSDYSRNCIWAIPAKANGDPDPSKVESFAMDSPGPVNLKVGSDGGLYYPDFSDGEIHVIRYFENNQPPTAVLAANPTSGGSPLTVHFDGGRSSDPDSTTPLSYAWDFDDDGQFDDATGAQATHTFTQQGNHLVRLQITDGDGDSDSAQISIAVGNTPPTAEILTPGAQFKWAVDDEIDFSGQATDAEQVSLPAAALDWKVILNHCPSNCHQHSLQGFPGTASGSFPAPDHDYPAYLELQLTATDAGGLSDTDSVELHPKTVGLTMASEPSGAPLTLNASTQQAPFSSEVIAGSSNTISAPESFESGGGLFDWADWGDGGERNQTVVAPPTDRTYTARYEPRDGTPGPGPGPGSGPGPGPGTGQPGDTTAPTTRLLGGRHGRTTDRTPTFRFRGHDPGGGSGESARAKLRFLCRVDRRRWRSCRAPKTVRRKLRAGRRHTFRVRAVDRAGNRDPTPAMRRIRIVRHKHH